MTGEHLHISKQRISINPSLFFILNTAHSDPRIKIDLKIGNDANLEEHALNLKDSTWKKRHREILPEH